MTQSSSPSSPPPIIGVLNKQDIEDEINNGQLILNASRDQIQPCSYDMRIGTIFRDGKIIKDSNAQIIVQPGEIISIFTLEELDLPKDIMATAFAINEQSSRGLLILNPGHVDPGFKGPLTVQALNLRKVPLALTQGGDIFTVIFQRLTHSTTSPYGENIPRDKREREYNERNVELAPRSLSQLVVLGQDSPFPTRQEVKEIVLSHWMSWLTLILTFIAALTGILAVILANISSNQNMNNQSQDPAKINQPNR
jgi:deoxycytidine triphosphate deaminase